MNQSYIYILCAAFMCTPWPPLPCLQTWGRCTFFSLRILPLYSTVYIRTIIINLWLEALYKGGRGRGRADCISGQVNWPHLLNILHPISILLGSLHFVFAFCSRNTVTKDPIVSYLITLKTSNMSAPRRGLTYFVVCFVDRSPISQSPAQNFLQCQNCKLYI